MKTQGPAVKEGNLSFRLYIANETPKSLNAIANLKKICKERLKDKCHMEIIDILKDPDAATRDQIVAIPTLLSEAPKTKARTKTIVGDLSDATKVLAALGV